MKLPLLLAVLLGASCASPAILAKKKAEPPVVVPTADATLQAINLVAKDSKARQADLLRQAQGLRDRLAALKAKARNPHEDLAEQLSKEQMDQFNLLSAQLHYLQNAALIEEVRQRHLLLVKDIYQASFFTATMASEYVADKGSLDDGFDDYCLGKAREYNLGLPVSLLFNAENFVTYQPAPPKK